MKTRTKKRKKKKHYKTGIHESAKCTNGPIKYRSGWEYAVCLHLDDDPNVTSYEYEPLSIEYISNTHTKRKRHYIPDFLIIYSNKPKKLVEVKRKKSLTNRLVMKKAEAARIWCEQNGVQYEFWTEKQIFPLQKIQKALAEALEKKK